MLVLIFSASPAQESHYGMFYSYGAHFNFHASNSSTFKPSDGSTFGIYYHLDNGLRALGFRSALSLRTNDIKFDVTESNYIINNQRAVELKLQCVFPMTTHHSFALGISPRIVTHSHFSLGFSSKNNQTTYEEQHTIAGVISDLNEMNSALSLCWFYKFSPHLHFAINLDQDMLTSYHEDVAFPGLFDETSVRINSRMTSVTASLILNVR